MDRDDMENREIYVHDTQVSKREIENAEESLHTREIIGDSSSILLYKLRKAAFDGALTPYKVDFLKKDITNFTICRILMHMLINVADFRTTDKDEKKEVIARLAGLYLPLGDKHKTVDWNALMDKSPALFAKMAEYYLEIVRKFDEALSLFDHNDVFCKQCRIRRISNAIYKGKITVFVSGNNDVYMKFVDGSKEYSASLVLGDYNWMKQKDKENNSLEEKSLFGLNMTPQDPFEDTAEEVLSNMSLEAIADRIDLIFSHWRDTNLDSDAVVPFYRILNMILEDESLCIQSDNCPEIKKCRNIMVKINGPRCNLFMSNGMHW